MGSWNNIFESSYKLINFIQNIASFSVLPAVGLETLCLLPMDNFLQRHAHTGIMVTVVFKNDNDSSTMIPRRRVS